MHVRGQGVRRAQRPILPEAVIGMSVENEDPLRKMWLESSSAGQSRDRHCVLHTRMETHFDVLVLGTGLTQSITAA